MQDRVVGKRDGAGLARVDRKEKVLCSDRRDLAGATWWLVDSSLKNRSRKDRVALQWFGAKSSCQTWS